MPIDCQDGLTRPIAEPYPVFSNILIGTTLINLINNAFSQFLHEGCWLQSQERCDSLGVEHEISRRIMLGHSFAYDLWWACFQL